MSQIQPFTFPATVNLAPEDDEPVIKGLESHLYVVEFGAHGIKVGITADPATRLQKHQRDGRAFGRPATRGWLSGPHVEARQNERALIDYCRDLVDDHESPGEYFPVSFDWVVGVADGLPRSRGDRAAFEEKKRSTLNTLLTAIGWSPEAAAHIADFGTRRDEDAAS